MHLDPWLPVSTQFLRLSSSGEYATTVTVPALLPPGTTLTMQAATLLGSGQGILSNPHKVITVL